MIHRYGDWLPSRADIEATITQEARPPLPPLDAATRQLIYRWRSVEEGQLDPAVRQAFLDAHGPENQATVQLEGHLDWYAARWAYYQLSLQEALRLGYVPHPELAFTHDPYVLIEEVHGAEQGLALAQRWAFELPQIQPDSMWDIMAWRRDGDAVVLMIGDDRGYAPHWTYWIAVAWSPPREAAAMELHW